MTSAAERWHHFRWKAADLLQKKSNLKKVKNKKGKWKPDTAKQPNVRDDIILGGRRQIFCKITLLLLTSHFQYFHCCCCHYNKTTTTEDQLVVPWTVLRCAIVSTTNTRDNWSDLITYCNSCDSGCCFFCTFTFAASARGGLLREQNGVQHKQGLWQCGDYD